MAKKIYIFLFFVVCLVPFATTFTQGFLPSDEEITPFASQVALKDAANNINVNYLSDVSAWFDDNHGLKKPMISVYNKIVAMVFGESAEENVILGKDGWMFYSETLDDYEGRNTMSDGEIRAAVRTIELMNEYVVSNSMDFVFLIAPNKNSLYPEMMPGYYPRSEGISDARKILVELDKSDIKHIDLFDKLRDEDKPLYLKTDSHWNSRGAALAADSIINAVSGKEGKFYSGFKGKYKRIEGDLYKMIYPSFKNREKQLSYKGTLNFRYQTPIRSPEDITIKTRCHGKSGSLFMFRDSFGNSLYPYLAESYGKCVFSRINPYNLTLAVNEETDAVVIELVERNLDWLLTKPPVFPSPVRKENTDALTSAGATLEIYTADELMGYKKVKGVLKNRKTPQNPAVYIFAEDKLYEAIPTGENTFVAYIPENVSMDGPMVYVK